MIDDFLPARFRRLLNNTTNVYVDILDEIAPYIASQVPFGESAWKICKSLSNLQRAKLTSFLSECGNIDIKTGIEILTEDLSANNIEYEIVQALTNLKKGRNTFLNIIEREHSKWGIFQSEDILRESYTKAFMASNLIAFCYRLLKDESMVKAARESSIVYYYHRIYYFSGVGKLTRETLKDARFRLTDKGMFCSEEAVSKSYREIQQEEEEFIEMLEQVFNRVVEPSLPESYEVSYHPGGLSTPGESYYEISVPWYPPLRFE
jgi:hypothetical protein